MILWLLLKNNFKSAMIMVKMLKAPERLSLHFIIRGCVVFSKTMVAKSFLEIRTLGKILSSKQLLFLTQAKIQH